MGTGIGHYIPLAAYLVCCLACLMALWRPLWGLYYMVPLLPYRTLRDHFLDYPLGGNLLTILVLCILVGALLQGKRLPRSGIYVTWLVFAVYLYMSMWLGVALSNAPLPLWINDLNFALWKDYMLLPLIFVAAGMVVEDRRAIRGVVIASALSILFIDRASLMSSLSHSWGHFDENKRDGGPLGFAGSNGLAAFLAQFALFLWAFVQFVKRRKAKLILYGLVAATLMATMYSFSRAGYIAVIAGAIVLGILKDRKLIPIAIVFLCVWQVIVPTAVSERVNMTHNANGQLEASAQERVDLWTAAKETIESNPIFGVGYGTFQLTTHVANLRDTHNWYVKVMLETGAIGMVMALVLLGQMMMLGFFLFRRGRDPLYRGLGLGLFLLMICSLILNCFGDRWTYLEIQGMTWVLFGAAARAKQLAQAEAIPVEQASPVEASPMPAYLAYR